MNKDTKMLAEAYEQVAVNKPMDEVKKRVEAFIRYYEEYLAETEKDNHSPVSGVLARIELAQEFISDLKDIQKLLQ